MNIINSVFEVSESFMNDSKYVNINHDNIFRVSKRMKDSGVKKFEFEHNSLEDEDEQLIRKLVFMELLGNSINYCYWYGRYDIRPNGSDSVMMYKLMEESFKKFRNVVSLNEDVVKDYISLLAEHRFPLLEERSKHLLETLSCSTDIIREIFRSKRHVYEPFEVLVKTIPGYSADIFLKRASLFFIQLNRRFGWYQDSISVLPIPADYQVPKMLEYYGCIEYSEGLKERIMNYILIPKNSLEECEIRAATILTSRELSKLTGWTTPDIDSWFWLRRKECSNPFHLTITTDY